MEGCHFCCPNHNGPIGTYRISRNIDSDFNLAIWWSRKDCQINLHHYRSIYTTSMGFSTYSTQNRQFKIPPTVFLSKPPNVMFANNSIDYSCHIKATELTYLSNHMESISRHIMPLVIHSLGGGHAYTKYLQLIIHIVSVVFT